jgi:hypothetical protein
MRLAALAVLVLLAPPGVSAWEGHGVATRAALEALGASPAVTVEPIDAFVAAERPRLAAALDEEEAWARVHVPGYPPTPEPLRLAGRDPATPARTALLEALRMNPEVPLALYLQELAPGDDRRPPIAWASVGVLPSPPRPDRWRFRALRPGEAVAPLDVVSTASDEPDHGADVGLFEDAGTPQGRRYGLGPLPFGNPRLVFGTQAPFHMGLWHESRLVLWLAPSLARTFPEVRLHQCAALARLAFATGHGYWGWRFLGWGLHYVQDLTQPYHAAAAPGVSTARLLAVGALDALGVHGPKRDLVQLVTNRHLALEAYAFDALVDAVQGGREGAPLLAALRDRSADAAAGAYDEAAPRARITAASSARAGHTDEAVVASLPARWVDDPRYDGPMDPWSELRAPGHAQERAALDALLRDHFRDLGAWTRAWTRAVGAGPAR